MRMRTVFVLAALFWCGLCLGQMPDTLWSRTYGGTEGDICASGQQTSDGGYILAGYTFSFGTGTPTYRNFWLLKTDADGDSVWSRAFGGDYDEICYSVTQTSDGGYVLAGNTRSYGVGVPGRENGWLLKTNANGDSVWSLASGGTNDDYWRCVRQSEDGGYVVGGGTSSFGSGGSDFWLMKTDGDGNVLWSKTVGASNYNEACIALEATADGDWALAGWSQLGYGNEDFCLVKTTSSGDSVWTRRYGGNGKDVCASVDVCSDGGFILGGLTFSIGAGGDDFWLVKTAANGDSLWSHRYGGSSTDECNWVRQTLDGGYILAGHTFSFGAGVDDLWLVKAAANGDSLWSRLLGGAAQDMAMAVEVTSDAGYVVAGSSDSYGHG